MSPEPDPRVVVKFEDRIKDDQRLDRAVQAFRQKFPEFPELRLEREFPSMTRSHFERLREFAPSLSQLMNYYSVVVPPGQEGALAERFASAPRVEKTYVKPVTLPPPEWRDAAPDGVGAVIVEHDPNAQGQGVSCALIETGWHVAVHPDLAGLNLATDGVNDATDRDHCTAVLGILGASPSPGSNGVTGVAPKLQQVTVVSQWRAATDTEPKVGDAITTATNLLQNGDVIIVQAQCTIPATPQDPAFPEVPIEADEAVLKAMQAATKKGITVVEAAGNNPAGLDLKDVVVVEHVKKADGSTEERRIHAMDPHALDPDPDKQEFRESGAVVVGALPTGTAGVNGFTGSCTGERVNCWAWGDGVRTCAPPPPPAPPPQPPVYPGYRFFGGTSAATAIVAGVAIATQGWFLSGGASGGLGNPARPEALRDLLATRGTDQKALGLGVMPNLPDIL